MSSYSNLLNSQSSILENIKKINENFKKDSPSRKTTLEYHDERIGKLEAAWKQFKENDIQLSLFEGEKIGPYYENRVYERLEQIYEETRSMLSKSKQRVLLKLEEGNLKSFDHIQDDHGASSSGTQKTSEEYFEKDERMMKNHLEIEGAGQPIKTLLNEQQSNIKAFERAVKNMNIENLEKKWQLEDKLKTITQRWEKVDTTYWKMDNMLDDMQAFESDYDRLERLYEFTKETINKKIWDNKHQEKSTPKIELPIFSGNYSQWTTFKDLFMEIVHCNNFISNAQKMQHLKSKLKGEPERLVQHLKISTENYETTWEILQQRYDNKRRLFTYQANILFNQSNMQVVNTVQLKRMHDTTIECMNAIKNLQYDTTTWDPMVVHILMQKLDSETSQSFQESLKDPRNMPSLEEFLKFIETKFMSMESNGNPIRPSVRNFQNMASSSKTNHNAMYSKSNIQQQKRQFEYKNVTKPFPSTKTFHNYIITCPKCSKQHGLYNCQEFLCMSAEEKLRSAKNLNVCINCLFSHNGELCTSKKKCKFCNESHSSILHEAIENAKSNSKKSNVGQQLNTHVTHGNSNEVLLATAQIKVMNKDGTMIVLRALLDQGSQVSLITENAAQRLQLKRNKFNAVVSGIGAASSTKCKGMLYLQCQAIYNNYKTNINALIMQSITNKLPSKTIDKNNLEHIQHLQLADPDFHVSQDIDLLLGADVYCDILLEGLIKQNNSSIIAQRTQLGWIVCGNYKTFKCHVVINNIQDIAQFWEQESLQDSSEEMNANDKCEQIYKETTMRLSDGRYQVRLPFKDNLIEQLGTSKPQAIAQFHQLERKMEKNITFATEYKGFIKEYEEMGHMKRVDRENTNVQYFLPHHGVLRPGAITTKLRVVFNASAKTSSKNSLNDLMEAGPNLQKDILSILLKWRQYKYVLTSDIEKMYRFIAVHPEHQPLQKIVWRDSPQDTLKEYQLCTVTYGFKAAPFLALRTLQQLATDEGDNYPEAKRVLLNQFFVDDAIFGQHSLDSARETRNQLIKLLKKGGFNLRKWSSNSEQLLNDLPRNMISPVQFNFTEEQTSKTLGLTWDPIQDQFIFSSTVQNKNKINNNKRLTKRQILSDISTIFDPLGWLSPITIKAKILFQRVWKYDIKWDDLVPEDIEKEWKTINNELKNMKQFQINRWLGIELNNECELHAFCDASEKAVSCVVYSKVRNGTQKPIITLVAAKTKVAPIKKQQTLPRLELCGAQLLAQLMNKIKHCLDKPQIKVTAYTDSMIVLGWLKGDITRWRAYVGNRVKEILSVIPFENWRHVRSEQNPADCASRGLLPSQLHKFPLWFNGPEWISCETIPQTIQLNNVNTEIEVKNLHTTMSSTYENVNNNIITQLLMNHSCFMSAVRVVAWLSRFITNTSQYKVQNNKIMQRSNETGARQCNLTLVDIQRATYIIIKHVQREHYEQELTALKTKGHVNKNSELIKLCPYLDKDGILRVGGRLQFSELPEVTKHPIIIPKNSRLTYLLIDRSHQLTLHGGARLTLANLRQRYWVIGGNNTVKKQLTKCVKCCRFKSTKQTQQMADLPSERITPSLPFYHVGVDFTGFVSIKLNKGRGIKTSKGYVVVFVCMTTKAVHLELASDLSTQTFLLALKRMIARRGCPKHIYSDNGTNFVGAERELARQLRIEQTLNNDNFWRNNIDLGIEWHFNAPAWPSAGGLWEAAVRSMKYHLKRVIGEQKLTYEEFITLLSQIEACMNSRPLCSLTEDIEDIDYLTPSHFLIGRPTTFFPQEDITEQNINFKQRWQLLTKLHQCFWKRWSSEYLQQLQVRSKWLYKTENLEVGDIVLIKEDNIPPAKWALGRIQEVHPGKDELVRVVTLKTESGILKRPITKLVKLPTSESKPESCDKGSPKPTSHCSTTQQQQQAYTDIKQKRRSTSKISASLLGVLITLLTLFHPTKQSNDIINVKPFTSNKPIYFDRIGNLQIVHDNWKIVTYYNMTTYWDGIKNIEKVVKHLGERCDEIPYKTVCKTVMIEFQQELSELDHNNYMLKTQNGQLKGRFRRGLINGVGYIANSLFGVLDERFADQYRKDIEKIQKNRYHLLNLIKDQTSIIEAQNNILKRNEESMNNQFQLVALHLNETNIYLKKVGKMVEEEQAMSYFSMMAVTTTVILSRLRHIQHIFLETATNVHHGQVDTRLLPQNQLLQELKIISGQLSQQLSIPVDNIQTQLADVYKLLEVKSRLTGNYFITELTLPLTSDNQFTIYQPIPVPMLMKNMSSLVMKTSSEYIAVNIRKETYMQLTNRDLDKCIKIEPSNYICSLHQPTRYMRNQQIPCEIGVITKSTIEKCISTYEDCTNRWIPLQEPNTWLYVCCKDCQLQIICERRMTTQTIHETGLIEAKEGCIIRTGEETYYTQVYHSNNMFINPEIPLIDLEDINNLTSVQPVNLSGIYINPSSVQNEYEHIQKSLEGLKKHESETEISQHDMHQYIVSYSTLGLIVVLIVVVGGIYGYCRSHRAVVGGQTGIRQAPPKPPRATHDNNEIHSTPHRFEV